MQNETPWDGSLISLPDSSRTASPTPDERHRTPERSLPNLSCDVAMSSLQDSTERPALHHGAPSPVVDALPGGEDSRLACGGGDNNSELGNPFQQTPRDRQHSHPQPQQHSHQLATYLFSGVSPPGSPLSAFSRTNPSSVDGAGRGRWGRSRSSTNGSSARSTSGSVSDASGQGDGLVMPSMRLPLEHRTSHEGASSSDVCSGHDGSRFLLLGRSREERHVLARHLASQVAEPETDMSASFLSGELSERSKSSSHLEDLLEEMQHKLPMTSFHHPPTAQVDIRDLAGRLLAPLERLEALINPTYPTTRRLADLASNGLRGGFEACLMLLSSPPTAAEVRDIRAISYTGLPVFPILILPRPTTSKPQKTAALVAAVSQQLNGAGVRWSSAFEQPGTDRAGPIYLLPHNLFDYAEWGDSSGVSSLSSSQELTPPSPSLSARSSSPAVKGDLCRLQELVTSTSSRERLRWNRTIAFLEWREIESAAKGHQMWAPSSLPAAWQDNETHEGERKDHLRLDFSKRVAERRAVLASSVRKPGDDDERISLPSLVADEVATDVAESYLTDPTTPRCTQRPLPSSPSEGDEFPFQHIDSYRFSPSPTPSVGMASSSLCGLTDPFHLPSLLHLVGLNLRLTLLPAPVVSQEKQRSTGIVWKALFVSAVFVGGFMCGTGSAMRLVHEVMRSGARISSSM